MRRDSFNVLFFIKKTKLLKNGEASVCMRITVNGARVETNIRKSIEPVSWNQAKECARGKSRKSTELNNYIEESRIKLHRIYTQLEENGELITARILQEKFFGVDKKVEQVRTIIGTMREHNEQCRALVGKDFALITVRRYESCTRYLAELIKLKYDKEDLPITEVNGELVRAFEFYLKTEKNCQQNTVIRYMKCLKKIINLALANEWIEKNPFAGIKFHEKEVVREFLTMDELMTIYQKEFSLPRLALVRDVFIFASFTGLAFIDVQQLVAEHIVQDNNGHYWIRKTRQKTNNMCNIPLLDIPLAILKKYENHPTCIKRGILLPVPCNQNMNSYLKEIADVCGIQKHLSTHVARHSYATSVCLANGVSIENVAKMLGHSNIKMTQHYAKVLDSSILKDILNNYQFDKVLARLIRNGLLYQMIQEIEALDLSLEKVDNHDMGYIFEELIRISNEQSNETAGEHFTPRDVIKLMSSIMFTPDKEVLNRKGIIRSIYDPTCGTGGMVNLGRNFILDNICGDNKKKPTINTYGQELNEQSYAIAKSEALITGANADNIRLGNTFTHDYFYANKFHYIMANPPYGVTWKKDQAYIEHESCNPDGRFWAGLPRVSDGQLLFLQHMISKMESADNGGGRIGVVTNGSPLFSGGAGSGESNIRKWIIENDILECVIALPKDLFYNTGIATYLWFLTNRKSKKRKGKVQLINAVEFCKSALKSLGNKRNEILDEHIEKITKLYMDFEENEYCQIYDNKFFGYLQLTVEQPLRDENGELVLKRGKMQPDPKKRDIENVPLLRDYKEYFDTEVRPHIDSEAWIDIPKSKIGYEINFTRYFYKYQKPATTIELGPQIVERGREIAKLMHELFD